MSWGISDLDKLADDLEKAGPKAETLAKAVVRKTGFDVVAAAQTLAPVDTGALKNSIGVDFDGDQLGFEAGPTVSYAPYQEYGTSKMAPQPFMGPAFERAVEPLPEVFKQIGEKALE